ncbi:ABC-2 family transporter protein [Dehalogenimonas formicexedens]|uniref:ABC-2 family transporter protein n=1 Tax=Dehalogenimonas formicexedens TaxID=1839801 RepID=A0A1P8F8F3_9CHLR|nr:ABC transporter permease [Dehalogenimonas formicexedens]APV44735.1 ABC-2 family transporter protein [Dehalogenimonas formicexedens]
MFRLIGAELFKLRKRGMSRILLFVLMGILAILYLILYAVSRANVPSVPGGPGQGDLQTVLGLPVAIPFALNMIASLGTVLAVILVASSMGNEYNWKTIRNTVTASESRFKLLGAKLISAFIFILIGMVIGVITGFVMSMITTAIGGNSFNFSFFTGSYAWDQFLQFWRTFFVMLPFIFLGFMLSIAGRSAMPGIALGIGVLFFEPVITGLMTLAGGWVAEIPKYLLGANVNAITALANLPEGFRGGFGGAGDAAAPSVLHATIVLSIYAIAFVTYAFYLFKKRDVTG